VSDLFRDIIMSKKIQLFLNTIFKTLQRIKEQKNTLLSSEVFTPQKFSVSFCTKYNLTSPNVISYC